MFAFILFTANKTNSFIRFLGEYTACQSCFRFYLTFNISNINFSLFEKIQQFSIIKRWKDENFCTFCQSGCAANLCGAFLNRSPNLLCSANSHNCNFRMAKFSSSSLVSGCCWSCSSDLSWYSCSDLSCLVWSWLQRYIY